jgi:hypothetical protein
VLGKVVARALALGAGGAGISEGSLAEAGAGDGLAVDTAGVPGAGSALQAPSKRVAITRAMSLLERRNGLAGASDIFELLLTRRIAGPQELEGRNRTELS